MIARNTSMDSFLAVADRIETYSSLAGFEALLRGVPVTVHGLPFYAGWGLTEDRVEAPRRGRHRSLDELVAVALIRYPRYWDPVSRMCCPPGLVLDRIAEARGERQSGRKRMLALAGRLVIASRRVRRWFRGNGNVA